MPDPTNRADRLATDTAAPEGCTGCEHPKHGDTDCEEVVGYDHLNGDHECGCPGPAPAVEGVETVERFGLSDEDWQDFQAWRRRKYAVSPVEPETSEAPLNWRQVSECCPACGRESGQSHARGDCDYNGPWFEPESRRAVGHVADVEATFREAMSHPVGTVGVVEGRLAVLIGKDDGPRRWEWLNGDWTAIPLGSVEVQGHVSDLAARIVQARAGEGALRERVEAWWLAEDGVTLDHAAAQGIGRAVRLRAALTTADPT